jgi:hypothetical protein
MRRNKSRNNSGAISERAKRKVELNRQKRGIATAGGSRIANIPRQRM